MRFLLCFILLGCLTATAQTLQADVSVVDDRPRYENARFLTVSNGMMFWQSPQKKSSGIFNPKTGKGDYQTMMVDMGCENIPGTKDFYSGSVLDCASGQGWELFDTETMPKANTIIYHFKRERLK